MPLSIDEIRQLLCPEQPENHVASRDLGTRIVVCQRGWVVVGNVSEEADVLVITSTSIVRRWGTTSGLGQLAKNGPLEDTQLDPAGTVRVHKLSVVLQLDCNAERWSQTCPK